MVKNLPASPGDARDPSLIPGSRRSPGVGNGNPLQYSCVENPMDRGAWWATVRGVTESDTTERPSTQQKPDRCSRLCPFPLPSRGSQLFRLRIPPLACLPIQATAEHSVELPVLCRRLSLLISSVRSTHGVYKSIPVSRFLPHPPVPLVSHTVLYVCVCISALIL